jgi:anti-sigma factor RsiW
MTHQHALDSKAAERYLLDEMPELERFQFEEHYFTCEACAEDVRTGALMRDGVRAGLLPAATADAPPVRTLIAASPAAATSAGWRQALPWAVAATLAVTLGYQTLFVVPGLRDGMVATQAVAPVTLRPATRGADPVIARPASGMLALAIDVAGVPGVASLAYDLRTADGVSVATGTAAAPIPGTPLLVLVPGTVLQSAGGYVLSVRAADESGSTPVDYRFVVTN